MGCAEETPLYTLAHRAMDTIRTDRGTIQNVDFIGHRHWAKQKETTVYQLVAGLESGLRVV